MTTNRISSFDAFVTWKHYPRIRTRRYLALISRLSFSFFTPGLLRCTVTVGSSSNPNESTIGHHRRQPSNNNNSKNNNNSSNKKINANFPTVKATIVLFQF
jgi:hypothetical protein